MGSVTKKAIEDSKLLLYCFLSFNCYTHIHYKIPIYSAVPHLFVKVKGRQSEKTVVCKSFTPYWDKQLE